LALNNKFNCYFTSSADLGYFYLDSVEWIFHWENFSIESTHGNINLILSDDTLNQFRQGN